MARPCTAQSGLAVSGAVTLIAATVAISTVYRRGAWRREEGVVNNGTMPTTWPHSEEPLSSAAANITTIPPAKDLPLFVLLIGDSTDRKLVTSTCAQQHGQITPMNSDIPKSVKHDVEHAEKLRQFTSMWCRELPEACPPSGWSVVLCFLSLGKLVLGHLANPFGLNPYGPWMGFFPKLWTGRPHAPSCFTNSSLVKQVHALDLRAAFTKHFGNRLKILATFVDAMPTVVTVSSNYWDLARLRQCEPSLWWLVLTKKRSRSVWLEGWKANGTSLLNALAAQLPKAAFAWRLHSLPTYRGRDVERSKSPRAWAVDHMVKAVNDAGSKLSTATGIPLLNLPQEFPKLQRVCADGLHPTNPVNVCYMAYLLETLLPAAGPRHAKELCQKAR